MCTYLLLDGSVKYLRFKIKEEFGSGTLCDGKKHNLHKVKLNRVLRSERATIHWIFFLRIIELVVAFIPIFLPWKMLLLLLLLRHGA